MSFYRAVRRGTFVKALLGKEPFYWVKSPASVREFGSKYGGWGIDTAALGQHTRLATFGLGEDISFENAVIEGFGCQVSGFDPTPRSVSFISQQPAHQNFRAYPYALGVQDGTLRFALPPETTADQVSASAVAQYTDDQSRTLEVPCLTLDSARTLAGLEHIDVLKMDIEGAEYAVIEQACANGWLKSISQILVEFHHFLPGLSAAQTRQAIDRLQAQGFRIRWIGRTNHEYLFTRT